jgi:hypothetical protein
VFRAKARRREEVKHEVFREAGIGLTLTAIGRKKQGERQRFYIYALIDPKDAPFVTFRYVFRTRGEYASRTTYCGETLTNNVQNSFAN